MTDSLIKKEVSIQRRIKSAFEEIGEPEHIAYDIGFHMTDWINDLEEIQEIYSNIEKLSNDEIVTFIYKFLAHVPNHLNAAKKLSGMGKVEDIFDANIFEDEDK